MKPRLTFMTDLEYLGVTATIVIGYFNKHFPENAVRVLRRTKTIKRKAIKLSCAIQGIDRSPVLQEYYEKVYRHLDSLEEELKLLLRNENEDFLGIIFWIRGRLITAALSTNIAPKTRKPSKRKKPEVKQEKKLDDETYEEDEDFEEDLVA